MTGVLNMHQAAAEVGLCYDRFRKARHELIAAGFPAPFRGSKWDAEAVRAWRLAQGRASPGRQRAASAAVPARARRDRAALAALQVAEQ